MIADRGIFSKIKLQLPISFRMKEQFFVTRFADSKNVDVNINKQSIIYRGTSLVKVECNVAFVTNQMICCDYLAKKHHKNCLPCYKMLKFLDETLVSKPSHNNAVVIIPNEVAVTVCKQPRNPEYS